MFPFKPHAVITCIGPRGSGKSYMNEHIIMNREFFNRFDRIYILSPTLDVNDDYHNAFLENSDKVYYESEVTKGAIDDIFEQMYAAKKREMDTKRLHIKEKIPERCPELLLILDDIIDSGVVHFGGAVDKFAERGRHINTTLFINAQRMSAVSRSIRINSDYIFLFRPYSISEIERFLEDFVSRDHRHWLRSKLDQIYEKQHEFIMLDNVTEDYRAKLKQGNTDSLLRNRLLVIDIPIEMDTPKRGSKRVREEHNDENPKRKLMK